MTDITQDTESRTSSSMSRQEFLRSCACAGVAMLSLPVLSTLESCSSTSYYQAQYSEAGARIALSAFANTSVVLLPRRHPINAPVFVKRTGAEQYSAVLMKCSHKGCELIQDGPHLSCPCHGSEFTQEGVVLSAPATENLRTFKVSMDNDSILVHLFV